MAYDESANRWKAADSTQMNEGEDAGMVKRLRRGVICLFTVILLASMVAACAGNSKEPAAKGAENSADSPKSANGEKQENLMVRWVLPGTAPQDQEAVEKVINDKLEQDGLNLTYKAIYVPWDVWDQKTNLMMSTGDPFELIHIMYDGKGPNVLASSGGIIPIDSYLDKYGSKLKESIPEWIWDSAKINGESYVIPDFWLDAASSDGMVTIRTDLLEANHIPLPTTPQELLNAAEVIQNTWSEGGKKPYISPLIEETPVYLHATYDTYPFIVFQNLVMVDQQGKVQSWLESEEFKKDAAYHREAYTRGLLNPDVLTAPKEITQTDDMNGHFLYREGNGLPSWEKMVQDDPDTQAKLDLVYLKEVKFRPYSLRNANGVSASSPHPEAAIQFLDWMYGSQENFDLVIYGVEGEHWEDLGPNKIKVLKKDSKGSNAYELPFWMAGNVKMGRWSDTTHPTHAKLQTTIVEDAVNSVTVGFSFDAKPVALEYANCLAELKTSMYPIKLGLVDYDKYITEAVKKMNAAGLEKVVTEYQKQFDEWRKTQAQ